MAVVWVAVGLGAATVSAEPLVTCHVAGDPQHRAWALERRDRPGAPGAAWVVVFTGRALDTPRAELPLPAAAPVVMADAVTLSYMSANGGRTVEWRVAPDGATLDLHVSFGLEVNVEPDLDPAVDAMNTDGPIAVSCSRGGHVEARATGDERLPRVIPGATEWVVGVGGAGSVGLFQSTAGRRYVMQTVSWGRELTRDYGPGMLRGRFAWAIEVVPVLYQLRPGHLSAVGVAPVLWRWNFTPRRRGSAFAELAMGGLWSSAPIPEKTSRANFTAHWGAGARFGGAGGRRFVVAYRFQHISNGNQLSSNPGVNSHVLMVGWSRWRPR